MLLLLLLLLLSRFSCVRLCATPKTAAHQAPPSLGFSRQEHWSCHFLLQCMRVRSESEVAQSCPTHSNPMDCSLPGSSVHGIFQARVLECYYWAFLLTQMVKNLPAMQETQVSFFPSFPGSGRSPGEGNGNPLQCSCLGSPMDRGA